MPRCWSTRSTKTPWPKHLSAAADDPGTLRRRGLEQRGTLHWQRAAAETWQRLRTGRRTPRMKALFFLLDGETNASSHHRVLQYFPLLRQHGIRARRQPAGARAALPAPRRTRRRGSGAKAAFYSLFLAQRALDVLRADRLRRRGHPARPVSVRTALARTPAGSPQPEPGLRHRRRHVSTARRSRPTRRSSACAASTRSSTSSPRALGQRRHRAHRHLGTPLQPERLGRADGRRPRRVRPAPRHLRPARTQPRW